MVTTKKQRMVVDIGMVCLLPLLMAYSLIGELFHEVIGTLMMILMLVHLWQNRRWIFAIPKGRYLLLAQLTDWGPVLMYGVLKLTDVAKIIIAHLWLKKEKWVKNLTAQAA